MAAPASERHRPSFQLGPQRVVQMDGDQLVRVGARPGLFRYIRNIWAFRHFLQYDAHARTSSQNNLDSLGRFWMVMNPLLQAAVYFFIFGYILETHRGIVNFIGYLIIGVLTFRFIQGAVVSASNSIAGNQQVVQAFNFPRACLPISSAVRELFATVPTFVVMAVLVYFIGDYQIADMERASITLDWKWLMFFPAIFLGLMVMTGIGLILARVVANHNDVKHLISIGVRLWFYASAVIFSVDRFADRGHDWIITVMHYNPAFCILDIIRDAWLYDGLGEPFRWAVLGGWAVGALVIGMIIFWRGEETYGRER
ncbi:ABC transporter permease [Nesterenkonia salmonea]|uniref:Transport permease protein n=1 Tax=Nesterenkonia salmonea TaxID=1804987 RepID=A0A5R9BLP8_9MICC|nr:ABC transporter permease [Nesterenkonia salmonea]TLQ01465.1 ABC transporter permease [Nesterenkonia salmonea]